MISGNGNSATTQGMRAVYMEEFHARGWRDVIEEALAAATMLFEMLCVIADAMLAPQKPHASCGGVMNRL